MTREPNGHRHDWSGRKTIHTFRPDGERIIQEWQVCGECGQRRLMSERPVPEFGVGHVHRWSDQYRSPASGRVVQIQRCEICTLQRKLIDGVEQVGGAYPTLSYPPPTQNYVADHGGVDDYSPLTDIVTTADGTQFSRNDLLAANPTVLLDEINKMLDRVARERSGSFSRGFHPGASSGGIVPSYTDARMVSETLVNNSRFERRISSADALKLILDEIKGSEDPMKSAGEWITKFTNGVMDITRNLEE